MYNLYKKNQRFVTW